MKRWAIVAVLAALLAACQQPPAYQSPFPSTDETSSALSVVAPVPTASPTAQPTPTGATFFDTFDRQGGDHGLGEGWDLRGAFTGDFPLQPATDGFIRDGRYTYAGDTVVCAARQFRAPVDSVGAIGRWTRSGRGSETTFAMAVSANDLLISDVIHLSVNRSAWELSVRRNTGAFEPVARGRFSPVLDLDTDYGFQLDVSAESVGVTVPGAQVTKSVDTVGLAGDRAYWAEYPNAAKAGIVFEFDTVWAVERGQPPAPVPSR